MERGRGEIVDQGGRYIFVSFSWFTLKIQSNTVTAKDMCIYCEHCDGC